MKYPFYVFHIKRMEKQELVKYLFWSRDWKLEDELEFYISPEFIEPANEVDYILALIDSAQEKKLFLSRVPQDSFQFLLIQKNEGIYGDMRDEDNESGNYREPESTEKLEYLGLYNSNA